MSIIHTKKTMGVELSTKLGVVSKYKLRVFKPDSGFIVKESGWSENIIPTVGLDLALRGGLHGNPSLSCQVGTGNAVPNMTNTGLQAPFGSKVTVFSEAVSWQTTVEPFWRKATCVFRFAAGTFNNTNIAEVGTIEQFGSGFYSRALVVDANGNPAAVTIAADEALDVIWEHYTVASTMSGTFNQLIDGVSTVFNYVTRPGGMSNSPGWGSGRSGPFIQPNISQVSGTSSAWHSCTAVGAASSNSPQGGVLNGYFNSSAGSPTFVPGSGVRNLRFNVPLANANAVQGISGFHFDLSNIRFNMFLTPTVMKVGTKIYYIDLQVAMANATLPE